MCYCVRAKKNDVTLHHLLKHGFAKAIAASPADKQHASFTRLSVIKFVEFVGGKNWLKIYKIISHFDEVIFQFQTLDFVAYLEYKTVESTTSQD